MPASISLHPDERNTLLDYYRHHADPALRLRAHIILLLDDGLTWMAITAVLYCSSRTIARWQQRFARGRVEALFGHTPGRPTGRTAGLILVLVHWVTRKVPADFGLLRSRWCCATLVLLLARIHHVHVSRETVRRCLHAAQPELVWRRPRPVLKRQDPQRHTILQGLRTLLRDLPADEVAVFEDEVDVATNPKIGCMWMPKGRQAEVVTPGDNTKRYVAGSLNWRTGAMIATTGAKRDAALFVAHLHELRRRLRRYKKIHVICDNAKFHESFAVAEFLYRHGDRVVLHFLPKYAPECNPIERVWWHLHDEITRNHRCGDIDALLDRVFAWLAGRTPFQVEGSVYPPAAKAG
jgi:putative transposase